MTQQLVPIPWQPHLFLTPHTLSYLVAASRRVGHDLYLYDEDYKTISPAWRPLAQQLTAWLLGIAGRGPTASSPYTGQRNHMRGAAFDLVEQSKAVRAACAYVGLIPDPNEDWHHNDPLWRSMPIIKTMPTPASASKEDEDMTLYVLTDAKNAWALLNTRTGDHELTRTAAQANQWARLFGNAHPISNADLNEGIRVIKATA